MRIAVLAGIFSCIAVAAASSSKVNAQSSVPVMNTASLAPVKVSVLNTLDTKAQEAKKAEQVEAPKPEPKVHEVAPNESLTTIATQYETTWNRLFNKNTHIANPDVINQGDKITIPLPDEQLAERPLPEPPVVAQAVAAPAAPRAPQTPRAKTAYTAPAPTNVSRGAVAGNTYTPGWCTWYAKNKRPDLPNNLGNANTWVARAAAQGIPTGSAPRVGAIGQRGSHVVYVERVNGDGTIFISEMNYSGLYAINTRTVPASYFMYIY
jgi:surface antigen